MSKIALLLLMTGAASAQQSEASRPSPDGARNGLSAMLRGATDEALANLKNAPSAAAAYARGVLLQETGELDLAQLAQIDALDRASRQADAAPAALAAARRLDTLAGEAPGERKAGIAARLGKLDAAKLPSEVRRRVLLLRAGYVRRDGDEKGARELEAQAGCPQRWRIAGPFGRLPHLDLDTAFPIDSGLGTVETRLAPTRGCSVTIDGPQARSGVVYAGGWLQMPKSGSVTIGVDGDGWFRVFVDGQPLPDSATRGRDERRYPPRVRMTTVELPSGWHEVVFKLAASGGRSEQRLVVFDSANLGAKFSDEPHAAPRAKSPPKTAAWQPTPGNGALAALLDVEQALAVGDGDAGEAGIAKLRSSAPKFALTGLLAAQVALTDETRPVNFAHDRSRAFVEQALAAEPRLVRARNLRAQMALASDRPREALVRLAEAPPSRYWRFAFSRYQAYQARGWAHESDAALDEAAKLAPDVCPVLSAVASMRKQHGDIKGALVAAARAAVCDGGSDELAEELREAHDLPRAISEYERLLALEPAHESWRSGYAEALLAGGRYADAAKQLGDLAARHPRSTQYHRQLADARMALGDVAGARRALEDGLAETPESAELARALEALCDGKGCGGVDDFRVDGRTIIAEWLKRPDRPTAPAVVVLDRTVVRVFPTGARLTLTHNIIQVLAKSGIDKWGEVQVPDGADLITLRTIKKDGSTREPEDISGKETISAPDLEVGDFVEFEYLEPAAPPAAFPGGFLGERFYFGSFDAPLWRSELVLATPHKMPVVLDRRGGAADAAPVQNARGLDVRMFTRRDCDQVFAEPASVPHAEYLPSVRPGGNVSIVGWRDFLRDSLTGVRRGNDELRAVAARETRGLTSPADKVAALNRWVRKNIKGAGLLAEPATHILARGEGNRLTILAALLDAAQVPSAIWLSRAATDAQLDGPLPDLEAWDEPVLAVDVGKPQPLFVEARYRHAAEGLLSTEVRGQRALVLEPGALRIAQLPDGADDLRKVVLKAKVDKDGAGVVEVEETLRGLSAVTWREALDKLEADRVRPQFETVTLARYFPGSTLKDLQWEHANDDARDFVVRYRFTCPQLLRKDGDQLVVAAPFPAMLTRRYVGVSKRAAAMYVEYVPHNVLEARFELPKERPNLFVPPPIVLNGIGNFRQTVDMKNGVLNVDSTFDLPRQRVAPEKYPAFIQFAVGVDRAETRAAEIR
jgi:tetratricopeptide (TPR) repeat protein